MIFKEHVQPNGLRLFLGGLPDAKYTNITVRVGVGATHESPSQLGISHFLEHMLFRGTLVHPNMEEQAEACELLGSRMEAYTTDDCTVYSLNLRPECLEDGLRLFQDMFTKPAFRDIELERDIIREEIQGILDVNGFIQDTDWLLQRSLYPSDNRGALACGTMETVGKIDPYSLWEWLRDKYTGSNIAVAISGGNEEQALELVSKTLGILKAGKRSEPKLVSEESNPEVVQHKDASASQVSIRIGWRINQPISKLRPKITQMLANFLGRHLFKILVQEEGLCYSTHAYSTPNKDCTIFSFGAECSPENFKEVREVLEAIPLTTLSEKYLASEVSLFQFEVAKAEQDPSETSSTILARLALGLENQEPYPVTSITMEDLNEVLELLLNVKPSIVFVEPLEPAGSVTHFSTEDTPLR